MLTSCLLLFLWSCEKDVEELSEGATPESLQASDFFTKASPQVYRAAGDAYREDMFNFTQNLETGTLELTNAVDDIYLGTRESVLGELTGYVHQGIVGDQDLSKLSEFTDAIPTLGLTGNMPLVEARSIVADWMQGNGVTVAEYPLTYHAISVATEAVLKTQVTRLEEDLKQQIVSKGANDNTLCTVRGTFCSQTNQTVSLAAQAALALGVRQAFRSASSWTTLQQDAATTAIVLIITTFWDVAFCNEDCDNCGPAAGIRAVYNGCTFMGIQAVGTFEHGEGFTYLIDVNQDGVYEMQRDIFDNIGFVPRTSLPTAPFKVIVDVLCDGGRGNVPGSTMPWPVDRQAAVYINPALPVAPARPTANFTQPPLQGDASSNGYPYFYPANTQLCFGMTNLATRGWTFVGWRTIGGNPSSGSFTSSFCTTYSATQAINRSVYAEFSHPCSPTNFRLAGPSFVIKP